MYTIASCGAAGCAKNGDTKPNSSPNMRGMVTRSNARARHPFYLHGHRHHTYVIARLSVSTLVFLGV